MTIVCIQSHLHNLHLHRHDLSCLPVFNSATYITRDLTVGSRLVRDSKARLDPNGVLTGETHSPKAGRYADMLNGTLGALVTRRHRQSAGSVAQTLPRAHEACRPRSNNVR